MKAFLSLLVVANLLLFGWFRGWMAPFGGDGREPQRLERQVSPERLRIVGAPRAQTAPAAPSAPAAPASSTAAGGAAPTPPAAAAASEPPASPAALAAAMKAANCAELGPLSEPETVRLHAAFESMPGEFATSTRRADEISSWMVFVVSRPNELQKRLDDLRERGVKDLYVLPESSAWRGAVSLGLFKQEDLALALQKSVAARGVRNVRVAPRGAGSGPMTVQVRPASDTLIGELPKLRAAIPAAVARPCGAGG
ncbi:MAG: hypothetical protein RJA99_3677 [Pseudomonadota bacterium]|jgi:hypothetical protein